MLDNTVCEQRAPIDRSDELKQSRVEAEKRSTEQHHFRGKRIPRLEAVSSNNNDDHGSGSGGYMTRNFDI
jgi:hypothetical protein